MLKKMIRIITACLCLFMLVGCTLDKEKTQEDELQEAGIENSEDLYLSKDIWLYKAHLKNEKVNAYMLKYSSDTFEKKYGINFKDKDTVHLKIIKDGKEIFNKDVVVSVSNDKKQNLGFSNLKADDKIDHNLKEKYHFIITYNNKTADIYLKKQNRDEQQW